MSEYSALSIAGLDPSGGAGLLADIKTFEAHRVTGFGVASAITYQNENSFEGLNWVSFEEIQKQLDALYMKYYIDFVKIGIIESLEVLQKIVDYLLSKDDKTIIVWDPVLSASAGFTFHENIDTELLEDILKKVHLITPNADEIKVLANNDAASLSKHCYVLLKGGHNENDANDVLYYLGKEVAEFQDNKMQGVAKHGSGCVLSSSITAFLAQDFEVNESCALAKMYIKNFLTSTDSLLGKHSQVEYKSSEENAD